MPVRTSSAGISSRLRVMTFAHGLLASALLLLSLHQAHACPGGNLSGNFSAAAAVLSPPPANACTIGAVCLCPMPFTLIDCDSTSGDDDNYRTYLALKWTVLACSALLAGGCVWRLVVITNHKIRRNISSPTAAPAPAPGPAAAGAPSSAGAAVGSVASASLVCCRGASRGCGSRCSGCGFGCISAFVSIVWDDSQLHILFLNLVGISLQCVGWVDMFGVEGIGHCAEFMFIWEVGFSVLTLCVSRLVVVFVRIDAKFHAPSARVAKALDVACVVFSVLVVLSIVLQGNSATVKAGQFLMSYASDALFVVLIGCSSIYTLPLLLPSQDVMVRRAQEPVNSLKFGQFHPNPLQFARFVAFVFSELGPCLWPMWCSFFCMHLPCCCPKLVSCLF